MKKSKRLAIMLKHKELVKAGKLEVAYHLLRLLHKHNITLGLGDSAWEAEEILEKLGCLITYPSPFYVANAHDYAR